MGKVIAVCTSPAKGTQKTNVGTANFIADWGIENDAHAGHWHRQVSLLSFDKIEAFRARGAQVADGAFGENLVVAGIDFRALPLGARFGCNDVVLELTQIGKECHSGCAIYKAMPLQPCATLSSFSQDAMRRAKTFAARSSVAPARPPGFFSIGMPVVSTRQAPVARS